MPKKRLIRRCCLIHLLTLFVKCGNGQWRQARIVSQKHQRLAGLGIFEADTPQLFGVVAGHVKSVQCDALIANHPGCPVGLSRIHAVSIHATLGAGHKEGSGLMQRVHLHGGFGTAKRRPPPPRCNKVRQSTVQQAGRGIDTASHALRWHRPVSSDAR